MFTRRNATMIACAACWIGVAAHTIAEPARYQGARSLMIGGGIALLLLLTRHRRPVSPMTIDVIDAIDVHATRMCEADEPCAPVIPLPCEPAPTHRRLARASAAILVAASALVLVAFGWDDVGRQADRPPRPPVLGAPPPAKPSPQQPTPSPTKRDPDESPPAGRETGKATSPTSPSGQPPRPGASSSGGSARDGGGAASSAGSAPAPTSTRSTSPTGTSTTADSGGEPAPRRTPIRRVIRRVAP